MKNIILINVLIGFLGSIVLAWGGRGHDSICETASFLVQEPGLKSFLKSRPHIMGHLCNIPDTQWRSIDSKLRASGDPTHYIDPEVIGLIPKTMPLDLKKLNADFNGKQNQFDPSKKIFNLTREMGSSWWRVDQFMNEVAKLKMSFTSATPPQNKSEEQDIKLGFNQSTYQFMVLIGIMGHFVGDASMPYHNTTDYDGWKSGHGGIHSYYEDLVVAELSGDLQKQILEASKKYKKAEFINKKFSTLEKMRSFSQTAFDEIKLIEKLDPVIKKSEMKTEKGMSLKTAAERKAPAEAAKKMQKMMVDQMARSAVLLAHLWDQAYLSAGQPDLSKYKSYQYPNTVDFIAPDYE